MLMTLGLFGFETGTAPYTEMARAIERRWAETHRVGVPPADQDLGPGPETLTLTGTLRPELTGGPDSLERLRAMMASGKAWLLISGEGAVMGRYIILSLEQTHTDLTGDGRARAIAFTLSLRRYWGGADGFGDLPDSAPQSGWTQAPGPGPRFAP